MVYPHLNTNKGANSVDSKIQTETTVNSLTMSPAGGGGGGGGGGVGGGGGEPRAYLNFGLNIFC